MAIAAAVCIGLSGCGASEEESGVRVSVVTIRSSLGVSHGVVLEIAEARKIKGMRVTLDLPSGVSVEPFGAPEGAVPSPPRARKMRWNLTEVDGPAVLGPFTVTVVGSPPSTAPALGASVLFDGGSAVTRDVVVREVGVVAGEGVLRPAPTTAKILIGHDTEITGYAMGLGIIEERGVVIARNPVLPPRPSEVTDLPVVVAEIDVRLRDETTATTVLEMTTPVPLPPNSPLVPLRHTDRDFSDPEPTGVSGRVGSDGSRVTLPIEGSGAYRLLAAPTVYKTGYQPMSEVVLGTYAKGAGRALDAAAVLQPAFRSGATVFATVEANTLFSVVRAEPSPLTDSPPPPPGVAFNGLLQCSPVSCLGSPGPDYFPVFCDLTQDITGCVPLIPEAAEVTMTVTGANPLFEHCKTDLCFVPGRGIVDSRPRHMRIANPVSIAAIENELIWIGDPAAA